MFIAIVGTPSSGKSTVLEYLVKQHGFREIHLEQSVSSTDVEPVLSNLSLTSSSPTPVEASSSSSTSTSSDQNTFTSVSVLLDYATRNWRDCLVTRDLKTWQDIRPFVKRPFFMLLNLDGPLNVRFQREKARANGGLTLEEFIKNHDELVYGRRPSSSYERINGQQEKQDGQRQIITDYKRIQGHATLSVHNDFESHQELYDHLEELDVLNEERLRPGWDTYFMTLASLASHRSNCMKRRVGALLVRSKRILSTGYNGTAKGTRNCNEGGCSRCNGSARGGESLNECLCLHAEENALLEAGKDRIGEDSVIYCNTCPCLRCSVKIVQCGVREVVYNQSYSMDEASARVLKEAGVILRQFHMPADMTAASL